MGHAFIVIRAAPRGPSIPKLAPNDDQGVAVVGVRAPGWGCGGGILDPLLVLLHVGHCHMEAVIRLDDIREVLLPPLATLAHVNRVLLWGWTQGRHCAATCPVRLTPAKESIVGCLPDPCLAPLVLTNGDRCRRA